MVQLLDRSRRNWQKVRAFAVEALLEATPNRATVAIAQVAVVTRLSCVDTPVPAEASTCCVNERWRCGRRLVSPLNGDGVRVLYAFCDVTATNLRTSRIITNMRVFCLSYSSVKTLSRVFIVTSLENGGCLATTNERASHDSHRKWSDRDSSATASMLFMLTVGSAT